MDQESGFRAALATDIEIAVQHYLDVLFDVEDGAPSLYKASVCINIDSAVYVTISYKGRVKRYEAMNPREQSNVYFACLHAGAIVNLRHMVQKKGPSEVHKETGISRAHIYKIINLESSPTLDMVALITRALKEYEFTESIENDEDPEIQILANTFKFEYK